MALYTVYSLSSDRADVLVRKLAVVFCRSMPQFIGRLVPVIKTCIPTSIVHPMLLAGQQEQQDPGPHGPEHVARRLGPEGAHDGHGPDVDGYEHRP